MALTRTCGWQMPAILVVLMFPMCVNSALAQGMDPMTTAAKDKDKAVVQSGYAVVTPTSANTSGLVVFETFGERHGTEMTQAGVLPADMTTLSMLFVSANGRLSKNLGVAIANPGATVANIILTLRDDAGALLSTLDLQVAAGAQTARFVTDLFSSHPTVPKDLTGTLQIKSDVPVAVVGLRFRGINFSTLPATNLSAPSAVPVISTGVGGPNAVILPQFAAGGGWATEIVLANSGTADLVVRVDLFTQGGTFLMATLNGQSKTSFTDIKIPAGGAVILAPATDGDDDGF